MSAPTVPVPGISGTAERRVGRDALHTGSLAVGWILLGVLWWRVLARTDTTLLLLAGVFVLGSLLLNVSATTLWVEHNLRIFLKKGPRTGAATTAIDYERDWVGRTVSADWGATSAASEVVVTVNGGTKYFVTTRPGAAEADEHPPVAA